MSAVQVFRPSKLIGRLSLLHQFPSDVDFETRCRLPTDFRKHKIQHVEIFRQQFPVEVHLRYILSLARGHNSLTR